MQARRGHVFGSIFTFTCCWALFLMQAEGQEYDPARIVPDVATDCPVPNTLFTADEFTVEQMYALLTPLVAHADSNNICAQTVTTMLVCVSDGTINVKEGCCSSACAASTQQALISTGAQCYREFIAIVCNDPNIRVKLERAMFGATRRCTGLDPSCELLQQPGNLVETAPDGSIRQVRQAGGNSTNSTSNATAAATSVNAVNITELQPGGNTTSITASSPSRNSSRPAAATVSSPAAAPASPYAEPDHFALVPAPVESVVLATPDEIGQVVSNTTNGNTTSSDRTSNAASALAAAGPATGVEAGTTAPTPGIIAQPAGALPNSTSASAITDSATAAPSAGNGSATAAGAPATPVATGAAGSSAAAHGAVLLAAVTSAVLLFVAAQSL